MRVPSSPAADRAVVARAGFPAFLELAAREQGRQGLLGGPYMHAWHFEELAIHLERLHYGDLFTLLVSGPPGVGKSVPVSRYFPAWVWTINPEWPIMRAGFDLTNTSKLATDSRELMQSHWYIDRWGEFVFDRIPGRASGAGEYWNAFGGFCKCGTIQSGAFVGRHARYMIVDDPIKGQDAIDEDPAIMRKARTWFKTVAQTRGAMGAPLRTIVNAQRFHEQDLNGLLLEMYEGKTDKFAHVMLPWHYEPERAFKTRWGRDRRTTKGEELFSNPTQRHHVASLLAAGENDPTYRSQYQQDPGSGASDIFPEDVFQPFGADAPAFADTIAAIVVDPSLTGKKRSDFMAVDVWGFRDGRFYCFYSEWVRRDFGAALEAIRRIRLDWPAQNIVIESTANGPAIANMLELEGVNGVVLVSPQEVAQKGQTNDASKIGRARAASFYFRSHRCYFDASAKWFAEKKRYMMRFPGSTHDDMVDTAVMAVIWLQFTYGGGRLFSEAMKGFDGEERTEREEQERRGQVGGVAGQMREAMRKLQEQSKHPVAHEGTITLDYGMLQEAAW